jgi:hypothetical protein
MATVDTRVLALETRLTHIEASVNKLFEAVNKCISLDQVQQLEILNGTMLDGMALEIETLTESVALLRSHIQV